MGLIDQIQRGKQPMPPRLVVYGTEGVGKSTFASQAPAPIFIQTEDGLAEIDCDRFPLSTTFDDVTAALSELHSEKHDYQTVVIDSLDWLE
ncbi:MAG TPA: oxidoreductase, partial [Planctomycetaceae bacterium]|nr:oxidoreductase [Planctomycetaceae bacterium]